MAIDPVCGMEVDEKNPPAESEYQGRTYYFCREECRQQFESNPEQYASRVA